MQRIRINQHGGGDFTLFDINSFFSDIDAFLEVDEWEISVDWCMSKRDGITAQQFELAGTYSDSEIRSLYATVYQTIDGAFTLKWQGETVATLLAVDSSFWEIESRNNAFIDHMLNKYGKHVPGI